MNLIFVLFSLTFAILVMRLFSMLCKHSRRAQNPKKVPLAKPRLPFGLREYVSTKCEKTVTAPGIQEMQNLISKLAHNDYDQRFCTDEVKEMNKSFEASYQQFLKNKEENRKGVIRPGAKLNSVPLNKYLKRFPIVKNK